VIAKRNKMKKLLLILLLPILSFSQNCVPTTIIINLDQYQGETSWDVKDSTGLVVADGSGYWSEPQYGVVTEQRCLPVGDLTFTIYDSYGDGINGALWGGLDGSYYVVQCYDTIISGTNAAFGYDTTHAILAAPCPPIFGCMDSSYVEFNPRADTSDGSCNTLIVFGCIDPTMYNYDALANTMSLVPACEFTLTLTDLIGDGWAPTSNLEVTQGGSVWNFTIDTIAYSQEYTINLTSPEPVSFKFSISNQGMQSAAHCGFKLTNPLGMTIIEVAAPFIQPLFKRTVPTYCGDYCIDRIFGCMDPLALNYVDTANTNTQCFYVLGCTNSSYLEYYTQGFVADTSDGSCDIKAEWGCTDSLAFNFDTIANIDNGGCLPVILGCMESLAFNFEPLANTPDTCIAVVSGCMSSIALNYDSLANTDDGSCIGVIYGCIDTLAFNYAPTANASDGSCIPVIYGCINPIMFNFDTVANTNDGTCIPYIYGCTDSIMFNYNPLANANNSSCTPFVLGCTDPSMLNYDPLSNTENFSCIEFLYGCMDEAALNYDSLANTENESCIIIIEGCMDLNAYNYSAEANVSDNDCLYDAGCITGPGLPYWLNDPCYAWVISVDDYCCGNEWDDVCQLTYNYCDGTYIGNIPARLTTEEVIVVYPNPASTTININKNVDINVLNYIGDIIISKTNTNILDVSTISSGLYVLQITYNNKTITKQLIKK